MRTSSTIRLRPGGSARQRPAAEVALAAVLIYAGGSSDAFAYIDPGSGGAIITGVLGFLAAVAYTMRKQWYRLKRVFSGKGAGKSDKPPPPPSR